MGGFFWKGSLMGCFGDNIFAGGEGVFFLSSGLLELCLRTPVPCWGFFFLREWRRQAKHDKKKEKKRAFLLFLWSLWYDCWMGGGKKKPWWLFYGGEGWRTHETPPNTEPPNTEGWRNTRDPPHTIGCPAATAAAVGQGGGGEEKRREVGR